MEEFVIDINKDINERQKLFIECVVNAANNEHASYFASRNEFHFSANWVHRIFCEDIITEIKPYYFSDQCIYRSSFGFRENSKLPNNIKLFYCDIFRKHFPDGELTSALCNS